MRIGLDFTPLMPVETGVDRFMLNLVQALSQARDDHEYVIFVHHEDRSRLPDLDGRWRVIAIRGRSRGRRLLFQQVELPTRLRRAGVDLLHSLAFLLPLRAPGLPQVLSVHDMTFFTHPELHNPLRRSRWFRGLVARSIRRADHILVPTYVVHDDVLRFDASRDPNTVHVAEYGVDPRFQRPSRAAIAEVQERLELPSRYVLYVGTVEPRKNLHRLLDAYGRLLEQGFDEHLVLAGPWGWDMYDFRPRLQEPRFAERVHLTGYLSQEDLVGVYAGASMLVYPSVEEGFGFPPLEAMAMGVPAVVSESSALGELYRQAAVVVKPEDSAEIAAAIARLASDQDLRAEKRRLGYALAQRLGWQATARRTLEVYTAACRRGTRRALG